MEGVSHDQLDDPTPLCPPNATVDGQRTGNKEGEIAEGEEIATSYPILRNENRSKEGLTLKFSDLEIVDITYLAEVAKKVENSTKDVSTPIPAQIEEQIHANAVKSLSQNPDVNKKIKDSLTLISTYKNLSLNKGAHSLILKDEVLVNQLILFLLDDSPKIVIAAFEVVKILYNNRANHNSLKNTPNFLESIEAVTRMSSLPSKFRDDARTMYGIVRAAKPPLTQQNNVSCDDSQENHNNRSVRPGGVSNKGNRSRNNDRETTISISPTVLHHVDRRQKITGAVVKLKGIISVTYNLNRNVCIIRAKPHVPPEVLGKTIANLGVECFLMRRENKEEVLIKMEADPGLENNLSALEQENVPTYPFEDEEEDVDENKETRRDTVARGDEAGEDNSVTGKIQSFLRKSFFW